MPPDKNQCGQAPENQRLASMGSPCRQSAKLVLQDILHRLERKQKNIKTLLAMLPTEMTPEQDDALWNIACELERR